MPELKVASWPKGNKRRFWSETKKRGTERVGLALSDSFSLQLNTALWTRPLLPFLPPAVQNLCKTSSYGTIFQSPKSLPVREANLCVCGEEGTIVNQWVFYWGQPNVNEAMQKLLGVGGTLKLMKNVMVYLRSGAKWWYLALWLLVCGSTNCGLHQCCIIELYTWMASLICCSQKCHPTRASAACSNPESHCLCMWMHICILRKNVIRIWNIEGASAWGSDLSIACLLACFSGHLLIFIYILCVSYRKQWCSATYEAACRESEASSVVEIPSCRHFMQ